MSLSVRFDVAGAVRDAQAAFEVRTMLNEKSLQAELRDYENTIASLVENGPPPGMAQEFFAMDFKGFVRRRNELRAKLDLPFVKTRVPTRGRKAAR